LLECNQAGDVSTERCHHHIALLSWSLLLFIITGSWGC